MNFWAVVAVISAFVIGICVGAILVYSWEKRFVERLTARCDRISDDLNRLSSEYEAFARTMPQDDIALWPNLAAYLRAKYHTNEFEPDCEDDSDNLYI